MHIKANPVANATNQNTNGEVSVETTQANEGAREAARRENAGEAQGRPLQEYRLGRDGNPPLCFKGHRIGVGTDRANDSTGWQDVDIFRTAGGRYVASVVRVSLWEGDRTNRDAKSSPTATGIIDWLRAGEDQLGLAAENAVASAAEDDPAFAAAWEERIE